METNNITMNTTVVINANAETTLIGGTKPPITGFKPEIGSDSRFV